MNRPALPMAPSPSWRLRTLQKLRKISACIPALLIAFLASSVAAAVEPLQGAHLEGFRLGVVMQRSAVTAGALARDGTDVVQRDTKWEAGLETGWSWAPSERGQLQLVFGLSPKSSALGRTFGTGGSVRYEGSGPTFSLGARVGLRVDAFASGPLWVLLGASEVKRRFEVTLIDGVGVARQRDRQGHLRMEAGVEWAVSSDWRARTLLVRSRQDFGQRPVDLMGHHGAQWSIAITRVWR